MFWFVQMLQFKFGDMMYTFFFHCGMIYTLCSSTWNSIKNCVYGSFIMGFLSGNYGLPQSATLFTVLTV